jgi:hypothetical protein
MGFFSHLEMLKLEKNMNPEPSGELEKCLVAGLA